MLAAECEHLGVGQLLAWLYTDGGPVQHGAPCTDDFRVRIASGGRGRLPEDGWALLRRAA